jgi:hypothetical protein
MTDTVSQLIRGNPGKKNYRIRVIYNSRILFLTYHVDIVHISN